MWYIVAFIAGAFIGTYLMGVLFLASRADSDMRRNFEEYHTNKEGDN